MAGENRETVYFPVCRQAGSFTATALAYEIN